MNKSNYSTVHCPDCGSPTRLVSVVPSAVSDKDELTYRCEVCQKEFKRNVKAKTLD
jgi:DNA-directed RNA polymerase subunit RPC12/RpoP